MGASGICWFVLPLGELRPKEAAQFQCLLLFLTSSAKECLLQQGREEKEPSCPYVCPSWPNQPHLQDAVTCKTVTVWTSCSTGRELFTAISALCWSHLLEKSQSQPTVALLCAVVGIVLSGRIWKRVQGCWERDRERSHRAHCTTWIYRLPSLWGRIYDVVSCWLVMRQH